MEVKNGIEGPIMVVGQDKLAYSLVADLLQSEHPVVLLTDDTQVAAESIGRDVADLTQLELLSRLPETINSRLLILLTADRLEEKRLLIRQVEERCTDDAVIAINLEAIHLEELQEQAVHTARLLGLNWTYPVQQTFFSEIIVNAHTSATVVTGLEKCLKNCWKKDPYVVRHGVSIRARIIAAMLREACYLVENDFASLESIDRACRNDAGYYLPFVGNFRYMDLMGTYAYGMVMKDLNKELSNMRDLPDMMKVLRETGRTGMDRGEGFYSYSPAEIACWEAIVKEFSLEIKELISKYDKESFDC